MYKSYNIIQTHVNEKYRVRYDHINRFEFPDYSYYFIITTSKSIGYDHHRHQGGYTVFPVSQPSLEPLTL